MPDVLLIQSSEDISGWHEDIERLLNGALFPIEYDEMVIVKDIDFFSMTVYR